MAIVGIGSGHASLKGMLVLVPGILAVYAAGQQDPKVRHALKLSFLPSTAGDCDGV